MITHNRKTRSRKTAGGGIALLFDKAKLCFKEYKIEKERPKYCVQQPRLRTHPEN